MASKSTDNERPSRSLATGAAAAAASLRRTRTDGGSTWKYGVEVVHFEPLFAYRPTVRPLLPVKSVAAPGLTVRFYPCLRLASKLKLNCKKAKDINEGQSGSSLVGQSARGGFCVFTKGSAKAAAIVLSFFSLSLAIPTSLKPPLFRKMIPLKLTPSSPKLGMRRRRGDGCSGRGGSARDILMFEERAATSMAAKTCLFIERMAAQLWWRVSYSSAAFSCQMDPYPYL